MKRKILPLIMMVIIAACTPEVIQPLRDDMKWCGDHIEGWGDSLMASPLTWPCIFLDWAMVIEAGYDELDDRQLLRNNMTHNFGYPGATANVLWQHWDGEADPRKDQILWPGRNSMFDTASITRFYDNVMHKMQSVGNYKFLALGIICTNSTDSTSPDFEGRGTQRYLIKEAYNASLYARFGTKYINPVLAFVNEQNDFEARHGFIPKKYLYGDGLHLNQAGAIVLGKWLAHRLVWCSGSSAASVISLIPKWKQKAA